MVGVVALIVVGPERLPELARTAGRWLGTARRMVGTFKADLEREMRAEELKKILEKQNELKGAYEIVEETRKDLRSAVDQLNSPLEGAPPGAPTSTDSAPSPTLGATASAGRDVAAPRSSPSDAQKEEKA